MWWQEHIVWHLLYARFIHKFLFDEWIVNTKEPFQKLFHQGMILASDWRKMSKRWWNVVDPMDILKKYEPDVLKTWILFLGPLEFTKSWDESSLKWIDNFFRKINSYLEKIQFSNIATNEELSLINSALKNITNDINNVNLNTAISKLIILFNSIQKLDYVTKETMNKFLIMLSIFAPSTAKQMWNNVWNNNEIFNEKWPSIDEWKIEIQNIKLPIQVNWKFKATINVPFWISQKDLLFKLNENWIISKYIWEKEIKKIVFVPNKIINFII
jgi:leucyl-tRNA synthetase